MHYRWVAACGCSGDCLVAATSNDYGDDFNRGGAAAHAGDDDDVDEPTKVC